MVVKWTKGRLKNIKVPRAKSRNPYGNMEVVSSKSQKIKPTIKLEDTLHERISKVTIRGQNRTFRNQGRKK